MGSGGPVPRQPSTPRSISAIAALAVAVLTAPLLALLVQVPWSSSVQRLTSSSAVSAMQLSLWTSCAAAGLALLLGTPLAWWLARSRSSAVGLLRPIVLAPIVLPPTVAGIALLALLGRRGVLGALIYQLTGSVVAFTPWAVVVAGLFVSMPFLILVLESAFRGLPLDYEDAARTDGATEFRIFAAVALPQATNALVTGTLLAWARALGEFGATMMFAGARQGHTLTWPMAVYAALEVDMADALALSVCMLGIAIAVVFALRKQLVRVFSH